MSATLVEKRCDCDEARWPKCAHPWYMAKFRYNGDAHKPNLTRYALEVLGLTATWENTKTEAEALAEQVRTAIRNGTYVSAKTKKNTVVATSDETTRVIMAAAITEFEADVIDQDDEKREQTKAGDKNHLKQLAGFKSKKHDGKKVGELPVDAVDTDVVKAFRRSDAIKSLAQSTWAKYRTTIQQFFTWCKKKQYTTATPFETLAADDKKALKRGQASKRNRRVKPAEEAALLKAAGRTRADDSTAERLQAIIVAAIETAMRLGELLALQWRDVHFETCTIYVRAEEVGASKKKKPRVVPMSTRLVALLQGLITDPNGERYGRHKYVFGDALGGRIKKIRKAWLTLVLRAHGHNPTWRKTSLSPVSAAKLAEIDLHFHDLRHEAASRWLDSGQWTLEEIRQALGHATVAQTATYLHAEGDSAIRAMQRFDAWRQQQEQPQQPTTPAAAAPPADANFCATCGRPMRGSRVPKLSPNAKAGSGDASGLRLVSNGKR